MDGEASVPKQNHAAEHRCRYRRRHLALMRRRPKPTRRAKTALQRDHPVQTAESVHGHPQLTVASMPAG